MPGPRRSATASQCARGLLTTYCQQHDGVCRAGRGGTTRRCRPTSDRMRRACGGAPSAARIAARRAPRADAGRSRRCVRRRAGRCGAPTACRPDARIRSGARRWRRSRPIRVCVRIRGGHRIEARARARRGLARSRRRDAGVGIECVAGRRRGARRAHRRCGDPRTIDFGGDAIWRDPPICPGFRGGFPAGGEDARGCLPSSRPWATRYV